MNIRGQLRRRLSPAISWRGVSGELGLTPSSVSEMRSTPLGVELYLDIAPPLTAARLRVAADQIAVAYGLARVRVVEDLNRADRLSLFLDRLVSIESRAYPEDAESVWFPSSPECPIPIGIDDQGHLVRLRILGHGALIGGNPGSGKSNGLRVILAGLAKARHVKILGIDPKRAELVLWRERLSGLVLGHEPDPTLALLSGLLDEIHRRANFLSTTGKAKLEPSHSLPAIVLVIDEWAELGAAGTSKERQQIDTTLRRVASLGRAVGCSAIFATQRPTSDAIDVGIRSLLAHRFALRCGDRYQADSILGVGTYEPAQLLGAVPGRALWSDGGPATAVQFFSVSDDQVSRLVCAGLNPDG